MTAAQITAAVRPLLDQIKRDHFRGGYEPSDEEAMGVLLAQFFDWDGIAVLTAAAFGVGESNFEMLHGEVNDLIAREQRRIRALERREAARMQARQVTREQRGQS